MVARVSREEQAPHERTALLSPGVLPQLAATLQQFPVSIVLAKEWGEWATLPASAQPSTANEIP
jgi:hypothetical protein